MPLPAPAGSSTRTSASVATTTVGSYRPYARPTQRQARGWGGWLTRLSEHRPQITGPASVLLILAGLVTLALAAPLQGSRKPALPHRRRRSSLLPAAGAALSAVVLALGGLGAFASGLSAAGVELPDLTRSHRMQVLLSRIPQPWKPARPAFVPAPEGSDLLLLGAAASGAGAAPAPAAASTTAELQPLRQSPAIQSQGEAAVEVIPAPAAWRLEGIRHQWQTWNNCGPATITMATSYFGRTQTQVQAAPFLKPNPNDKNVNPHELVEYVRSLGLQADWRVGGDPNRLKVLLANGMPVVVEIWYAPDPEDWMGHYRLLVGYDDAAGHFIAYDSNKAPGVNVVIPYSRFETEWRVFNRAYIPVYQPEKAPVVARILGRDRDDRLMYEHALAVAQGEVAADPANAFAWFNVGTNLAALGRTSEAAPAFDRARALKLPYRMLWYQFGPFDTYLAEGRLQDVLVLADANLQRTSDLEESHYYKGRALQAQGQTGAARTAFQAALKVNPKYPPAHHALATLG